MRERDDVMPTHRTGLTSSGSDRNRKPGRRFGAGQRHQKVSVEGGTWVVIFDDIPGKNEMLLRSNICPFIERIISFCRRVSHPQSKNKLTELWRARNGLFLSMKDSGVTSVASALTSNVYTSGEDTAAATGIAYLSRTFKETHMCDAMH